MNFHVKAGEPAAVPADLHAVAVRRDAQKKKPLLPAWLPRGLARRIHEAGDFTAREGQVGLLYPEEGGKQKTAVQRLLLVGMGEQDITGESLRLCGGVISQQVRKLRIGHLAVALPEVKGMATDWVAERLTEGLVLGNYRFTKYRKVEPDDEPDNLVREVTVVGAEIGKSVLQAVRRGQDLAESVCLARDLAHEPGNHCTALHLATASREIATKHGLKRRVLGAAELKKLGMGGILGVNQGSAEPPQLIVLEYRTGKKVPTLLLVGKGLTFDSGGISIKPSTGMQDMKYDMCGGAAVLSVMRAVAAERPPAVDVVALVPATDNMPGPGALKPGDIIRHYNGTTVEIITTDAEGRLLLADALAYGIEKFRPAAVIDIATLTGAVIVALGHHRTGLMSTHDGLANRLLSAGEATGEPLWRLPLGPEYAKQLKSQVADLKNAGDKGGGTITGGEFLKAFVGTTPWAHLDIAGTAWEFTEKSYIPKGPSGVGVRLLTEFIRSWDGLGETGTNGPPARIGR